MANVLNRLTLRYQGAVHTPDFPVSEWVINPDMTAVEGVPRRYWVLTGDIVTVMDQAAQDAVDEALTAAALAAKRTEQKARMDTELLLIAFAIFFAKQLNRMEAGTFVTLTTQSARDSIKAEVDNLNG